MASSQSEEKYKFIQKDRKKCELKLNNAETIESIKNLGIERRFMCQDRLKNHNVGKGFLFFNFLCRR